MRYTVQYSTVRCGVVEGSELNLAYRFRFYVQTDLTSVLSYSSPYERAKEMDSDSRRCGGGRTDGKERSGNTGEVLSRKKSHGCDEER